MSENLSKRARRVLDAFPAPPRETYGRELSQRTGLGAGVVLWALYDLEGQGHVVSRWEETDQRPRRRLYRLTDKGATELVKQRAGNAGASQPAPADA